MEEEERAVPSILLVHDGELADVGQLLEELDLGFDESSPHGTGAEAYAHAPVVVATPWDRRRVVPAPARRATPGIRCPVFSRPGRGSAIGIRAARSGAA